MCICVKKHNIVVFILTRIELKTELETVETVETELIVELTNIGCSSTELERREIIRQ